MPAVCLFLANDCFASAVSHSCAVDSPVGWFIPENSRQPSQIYIGNPEVFIDLTDTCRCFKLLDKVRMFR